MPGTTRAARIGILAAAIDGARLSVDVAAYSLNLWSIRDTLIHAHQRGAVVRMVMESDNMDDLEVQDLMDAGIPVVGDQHEGLMHDKFVIVDRAEVWTGSMNYTVGEAYTDNNDLIRIGLCKWPRITPTSSRKCSLTVFSAPIGLPILPIPS